VAEWLKAHAWKVCNGESRSRVRQNRRQAILGASRVASRGPQSDPSPSEDGKHALSMFSAIPIWEKRLYKAACLREQPEQYISAFW
jgi:hypothetical protein